MKTTGDRLPAQQHTVRVEAGPDVHMDKAAGIINILGLPLGCRYVSKVPVVLQRQMHQQAPGLEAALHALVHDPHIRAERTEVMSLLLPEHG